jgi:biopolymer transport protein ExbB
MNSLFWPGLAWNEWPLWPLIVASVIALAVILERCYSLRYRRIVPRNLFDFVSKELKKKEPDKVYLQQLISTCPLGAIFAVALNHANKPYAFLKEAVETEGRHAAYHLERFLPILATIAEISPLLGLFGTTIGVIELFTHLDPTLSDPAPIARGIALALYSTVYGLGVAVISMVAYRYFRRKVDAMIIAMEKETLRFLDLIARP